MKNIKIVIILVLCFCIRCYYGTNIKCLDDQVSTNFIRQINSIEFNLKSCGVANHLDKESFMSLLTNDLKVDYKIKDCLQSKNLEIPSLADFSALEECCRSRKVQKKLYPLCDVVIHIAEVGINKKDIIKLVSQIDNKLWQENGKLRGTVELMYLYYILEERE